MSKKFFFRDMILGLWVRGFIVAEECSALVCEVKRSKIKSLLKSRELFTQQYNVESQKTKSS
jgi:hypothetical protein